MPITQRTGPNSLRAGNRHIPRSPVPEPPRIDPSLIMDFHRLGQYVARRYDLEAPERRRRARGTKRYVPGVAIAVADHYGICRSTVDSARMFAERFTLCKPGGSTGCALPTTIR